MREDFCGTAAVCREWVRLGEGFAAVGVDLDAGVIGVARERMVRAGAEGRMRLVCGDAIGGGGDMSEGPDGERADVVYVGNFSIGEIHERAVLVRYLRASVARLREGGVMVCDTYAGESAFRTGYATRVHAVEPSIAEGIEGVRVHCTWEQREAEAMMARVVNAIHFRVEQRGEITLEMFDAFVYRWRLWSVPELRDAMLEAGFASVELQEGLEVGAEMGKWDAERRVVCVVGRV